MPFRLSGAIDDRRLSLLLPEGRSVLGSASDCGLRVDHPTVSRRHAEVEVVDGGVQVRDLGSRNGVWIGRERVDRATVAGGERIAFGKVWLVLEELASADLDLGVVLTPPVAEDEEAVSTRRGSTVGARLLEGLTQQILVELLARLEAGASELELARWAATQLFESVPAADARVSSLSAGSEELLFAATRDRGRPEQGLLHASAAGRDLELSLNLTNRPLIEQLEPLLQAVGSVLRLAAPAAAPPTPITTAMCAPLPEPPTLVRAVQRIYADAARVASGGIGVVILGESGTGKEVLARYLHAASPHAGGPFVPLNCAALPRDLLEAELFGIDRGVATGVEPRPGKFELAEGGTLFLDEIADMATATQAKILRVLEEGEVYRLGAGSPRPARCRIVSATNHDLSRLRADGDFRDDLYYRLAGWVVELPPLRQRRADIPNMAAHFLLHHCGRRRITVPGITRAAVDALLAYHWPGNVRELENEMARVALFLSDGEALETGHLSRDILAGPPPGATGRLEECLSSAERREILRALELAGGVATEAAAILGIGRSTLYRRMKALGIDSPQE